jgi:hypothetical protein
MEKRERRRKDKLERIARINKRSCDKIPVYGQDLCGTVDMMKRPPIECIYQKEAMSRSHHRPEACFNTGLGYVHCYRAQHCKDFSHPAIMWSQTQALADLVRTPEDHLSQLQEILQRYVCF